jgi:uncharacterized protein
MPESYLATLIQPLISNPEAAKIEQSNDDMGVLLTLTVDKNDMGSVIGRGGETAKCIRHLLRVAGLKQGARISLKITEPDGSAYKPKRAFSEVSDAELLA